MNMTCLLAEASRDHLEWMECRREEYARTLERIEATCLFVQEAAAAGLNLPWPKYKYQATDMTVTVEDVRQFRLIHILVGPLAPSGMTNASDDPKKRLVWCHLRPKDERFHHLTFRYQKTLPHKGKCKVKRVRQPATSYVTVVCEAE